MVEVKCKVCAGITRNTVINVCASCVEEAAERKRQAKAIKNKKRQGPAIRAGLGYWKRLDA